MRSDFKTAESLYKDIQDGMRRPTRDQNPPFFKEKQEDPGPCPIVDEDGICKPSKTDRPKGPFPCDVRIGFSNCPIYKKYKDLFEVEK